MKNFLRNSLMLLAVGLLLGAPLWAQKANIPQHFETYHYDSGLHAGDISATTAKRAVTEVVKIRDAAWLRLSFSEVYLGKNSYLTITSTLDGHSQTLNSVTMAQWQNSSAYFNGDEVEIALYVSPFDHNVHFKMAEVLVGDWVSGQVQTESQCGPNDDRTASTDPAVARLLNIGCTAWIISNGKMVSAGHCVSLSTLVNVVEFNVPLSNSDGTLVAPGPEDQYVPDTATLDFVDGGIGNDWGVFEVFANTETGLMPIDAQGASFTVVQDLDPVNIRITGFGVDSGSDNQTQQTHVGGNAASSGTTMRYTADTEGGNSGSPVIDDATGNAVGVHTHGGCTTLGTGNNSGTSTFSTAFWDALDIDGGGLQAPVVSDIADQTITEGGAFATVNLDDFVTDGDNTDAEISWSTSGGSSITVSIDGSNVATITAAAGFIGSETITFTATDPDGQSDSDDATYTVNEDGGGGGDAPVVSGIADQTITGEFVQLNLDDFVDDADNADSELTWTFSGDVNLVILYRADLRACRISGSAGWEGSETITFTATDPDGNTGSQDATFTVGDGGGGGDPEPPVVSDIPDATITGAFVQIDLNIYVDDPDTDDSAIDWTFSASSNLIIQYRADLNMCRVSAVAGFTGSETITFTATDPDGLSDSDDATFTVNEAVREGVNGLVNETSLQGNFPNPFNPTTTIRYALEASSEVTLKVYNTLGQEVITLVSAQRNAGQHSVVWDGRNAQGEHVASGIYIYRLVAGDYVQTRKLMFNK